MKRFLGNPLSFKHLQFYQHTVLICIIFKTALQAVTKEISPYQPIMLCLPSISWAPKVWFTNFPLKILKNFTLINIALDLIIYTFFHFKNLNFSLVHDKQTIYQINFKNIILDSSPFFKTFYYLIKTMICIATRHFFHSGLGI